MIISYWNALRHGSSDKEFWLPSPQATIEERMKSFLYCVPELKFQKGMVLSYAWFREAARIKKRLLTRGDKDTSFLDDILANISYTQCPDYLKKEATLEVQELFMVGEETLTPFIPGFRPIKSSEEKLEPRDIAKATLARYKDEEPGSWKHMLYSNLDDVVAVLCTSPKVPISRNIYVLEFDIDCPLWKQRVLLGAPSD